MYTGLYKNKEKSYYFYMYTRIKILVQPSLLLY